MNRTEQIKHVLNSKAWRSCAGATAHQNISVPEDRVVILTTESTGFKRVARIGARGGVTVRSWHSDALGQADQAARHAAAVAPIVEDTEATPIAHDRDAALVGEIRADLATRDYAIAARNARAITHPDLRASMIASVMSAARADSSELYPLTLDTSRGANVALQWSDGANEALASALKIARRDVHAARLASDDLRELVAALTDLGAPIGAVTYVRDYSGDPIPYHLGAMIGEGGLWLVDCCDELYLVAGSDVDALQYAVGYGYGSPDDHGWRIYDHLD